MSGESFVGKLNSFTITTSEGKVINLGSGDLFKVETGNLRFQEAAKKSLDPSFDVRSSSPLYALNFGRSLPGFFNQQAFNQPIPRFNRAGKVSMVEIDFSAIEKRILSLMEPASHEEPYSMRALLQSEFNKPPKKEAKTKVRKTPFKHYEALNTRKKKGGW